MTPRELKAALDAARPLVVLDVREPFELELAALPGVVHIPMRQVPERMGELEREAELVVLCHHGMRSGAVAHFLREQGFSHVHNLEGGIDAWSRDVDPGVPLY